MPETSTAPIFVAGYQRSGTTLLQALLGAHPSIAAPPETHFIFRVALHSRYFGDLGEDSNLERALDEALDAPADMLAEAEFDRDRVLERAKRGPRNYAGLFDALMSDFAERHGKARWSDKSPGVRVDHALALFPQAQVIHIIRDPRDVVASNLAAPWTQLDAANRARSWRAFTLRTIRMGAQLGCAQFLQVRYEDLTRDPRATLRLICTFLGEEYHEDMWADPSRRVGTVTTVASPWQQRALTSIQPAQEGAWRSRLTRAQASRVSAIVEPMLPALGYEPTGGRAAAVTRPPLRLVEAIHRASSRGRTRARRKPLSPEQLYLRAREFAAEPARRIAR